MMTLEQDTSTIQELVLGEIAKGLAMECNVEVPHRSFIYVQATNRGLLTT